MKQLDLQVIQQALTWIEHGHTVWLCTVLATFGSAPREPGSMLAALESGISIGSLSGGCVEEDFLERLQHGDFAADSAVVRYGDGGMAPNRPLPCGGVLDVLVERFVPTDGNRAHLDELFQALKGQQLLVRQIDLASGSRTLVTCSYAVPRVAVTPQCISIRVGAAQRLIIAGLSPVAEFCASFAQSMGYEVVVCDPRPEVIGWFAQSGVTVVEMLPAVYIERGGCHARTAVVALTHDPRMDDLTVLEALRTDAFYIGVMGSKRTSDKRRERLARIGQLSPPDLARVHAPIGLSLGSKTPAEIAISVMADILRVSNGVERSAL